MANDDEEYGEWIDKYIVEHGVNIAEKLVCGVVSGTFYEITLKQFLDKTKDVIAWHDVIKNKLDMYSDIGRDPLPFLRIFCENALKMGYSM